MTCILGYQGPDGVYLAADSRTTCGRSDILTDEAEKIIQCGAWQIAHSGPTRLRNLLRENVERCAACASPGKLSAALREIIADDGWAPDKDGAGPPGFGFTALAARDGRLFFIGADYSYVAVPVGRVTGCGSGGDYGIGAAAALLRRGRREVASILAEAIEIAAQHCSGCGGVVQFAYIPCEALPTAAAALPEIWPAEMTSELLMAPAVSCPGAGSSGTEYAIREVIGGRYLRPAGEVG